MSRTVRRVSPRPPRARGGAEAHALPRLVQAKLWENPCWLSFRINFLALHFNVPVYGWIERHWHLARPQYVVLYSLYLRDGSTAAEVCGSAGFPKNTLSRAIQRLLAKKLVSRTRSEADRRSYVLRLTAAGRRVLDATVPPMIEREDEMLHGLTVAERRQLAALLDKLVTDFPRWPAQLDLQEKR
jgi:DNA-binding MarR family transcriptional regulator